MLRPAFALTYLLSVFGTFTRALLDFALLGRWQVDPSATGLRKADCDCLFCGTGAVLALANFVDLLMNEFARLRARRLSFSLVLSCLFDGFSARHHFLLCSGEDVFGPAASACRCKGSRRQPSSVRSGGPTGKCFVRDCRSAFAVGFSGTSGFCGSSGLLRRRRLIFLFVTKAENEIGCYLTANRDLSSKLCRKVHVRCRNQSETETLASRSRLAPVQRKGRQGIRAIARRRTQTVLANCPTRARERGSRQLGPICSATEP